MRLRKAHCVITLLALLWSGAPVTAKPARAVTAVEAAASCGALMTDPAQVKSALRRGGWKDVTPSVGGAPMASITGSSQYRRGRDAALVSGPGAMVTPNCEFTLTGMSDTDYAETTRRLSQSFASQPQAKGGGMEWRTGAATLFIRRNGDSVTILWLPDSKDQK